MTETAPPPKQTQTVVGIPAKTSAREMKKEPVASQPKTQSAEAAAPVQSAPVAEAPQTKVAAPIELKQVEARPTELQSVPDSSITAAPGPKAPVLNRVASAVAPQPTAVATLPAATDDPSARFLIRLLLGGGLLAILLMAFYRSSETARVRGQVKETLASFERAQRFQVELIAALRTGFETGASEYITGVRRGYMQQVPVDEIRKVAPGVRLQPLKDQGVSNLLSCQGWTTGRLQQLRGIGPESASRISSAILALTKAVNGQPVPHPLGSAANAEKIYRPLYLIRYIRLNYFDQGTAFTAIVDELRPQCISVQERTSFIKWLVGSQKKGELHAALEAGRRLIGKTQSTEKEGAALALANERYAAATKLVNGRVSADLWVADIAEAPDYYLEALEQSLGRDPRSKLRASASRAVSASRNELATSVADAELSPGRSMPATEPPVVEPAAEPVPMRVMGNQDGVGFRISIKMGDVTIDPSPSKMTARAAECWIPAGQIKMVGSVKLEGGLLYVGANLRAVNGRSIEPALIDPSLAIAAREADCRTRMLDYWSNYTYASPAARASYLQWLVAGRSDPEADIGYVFLYFYGLERRALSDAQTDPAARAEIPAIVAEVRRLRSIYGKRTSFDRYSAGLLDHLESADSDVPPPLQRYYLSFALKQKLGRLAATGRPLPVEWAYTWYHNDPRTRLPAVGTRCPDELAALFRQEYTKKFGEGLIVAAGKTRLVINYRPASASFGSLVGQSVDLPDVTVMTGSYNKLEAIATECYEQLDAYSRLLGRNKDGKDSFEGKVLLPVSLWSEKQRAVIETFRAKCPDYSTYRLRQVLAAWGQQEKLSRATYVGLCRSLAGVGLGLEPDPRFGMDVPDLDEPVAFFPGDANEQPSNGFGLAALLLRLSSIVAASDGDFSDIEAQRLAQEIASNRDLTEAERHRLLARMAIYRVEAPPLTGLKSAIAERSEHERQRLMDFLLTMAFADGVVAPGEVKVLEKIYTLFGLDPATLYTRLHDLSAGGAAQSVTKQAPKGPIRLDAEKVRQLREASEEVTRKLAVIFNEEQPAEEAIPKVEADPAGVDPVAGVLALDEAHAGLLVVLASRSQWTRAEFEEVCSERGLMPDGAIERINEAAFEKFDQPVIEGEDPLEIAAHLLEEQLYAADNTTKGP